jgi:hypothetical protein
MYGSSGRASINVSPRRKLDVEKEISTDALELSNSTTHCSILRLCRRPHSNSKKSPSAFYLLLHHLGFNLTAREGVNVILNLFVSDCEPLSTSIKNTLSVIALSGVGILLSASVNEILLKAAEFNENAKKGDAPGQVALHKA